MAVAHLRNKHNSFWEQLSEQNTQELLSAHGKALTIERWLELVRPRTSATAPPPPPPSVGPVLLSLPPAASPATPALPAEHATAFAAAVVAPSARVHSQPPRGVAVQAGVAAAADDQPQESRVLDWKTHAPPSSPPPPPRAKKQQRLLQPHAEPSGRKKRAEATEVLSDNDAPAIRNRAEQSEPKKRTVAKEVPSEDDASAMRNRADPPGRKKRTAPKDVFSDDDAPVMHTSVDHLTPSSAKRRPVPRRDE